MVQSVDRFEASGPAAGVRRREILAAASRLFRARGLHATGMREIAAALGMTAGNLYYYFEDKQALLAFCQESTLDELMAQAKRIATDDGAAATRLHRLVVAHVVALNETHPGSLAHLEIEALEPEHRAPLLRKRKRYEQIIRQLIETGIADGSFRPVDPGLATLALLGALNWTVKWFRSSGELTAATVGDRFAELFLAGLVAGSPGTTA